MKGCSDRVMQALWGSQGGPIKVAVYVALVDLLCLLNLGLNTPLFRQPTSADTLAIVFLAIFVSSSILLLAKVLRPKLWTIPGLWAVIFAAALVSHQELNIYLFGVIKKSSNQTRTGIEQQLTFYTDNHQLLLAFWAVVQLEAFDLEPHSTLYISLLSLFYISWRPIDFSDLAELFATSVFGLTKLVLMLLLVFRYSKLSDKISPRPTQDDKLIQSPMAENKTKRKVFWSVSAKDETSDNKQSKQGPKEYLDLRQSKSEAIQINLDPAISSNVPTLKQDSPDANKLSQELQDKSVSAENMSDEHPAAPPVAFTEMSSKSGHIAKLSKPPMMSMKDSFLVGKSLRSVLHADHSHLDADTLSRKMRGSVYEFHENECVMEITTDKHAVITNMGDTTPRSETKNLYEAIRVKINKGEPINMLSVFKTKEGKNLITVNGLVDSEEDNQMPKLKFQSYDKTTNKVILHSSHKTL